MYGGMRFISPWKNGAGSCEDDVQDECDMSDEHSSEISNSEEDLRELEELLYSQIHYTQNTCYSSAFIEGTDDDCEIEELGCGGKEVTADSVEVTSLGQSVQSKSVDEDVSDGSKGLYLSKQCAENIGINMDNEKADSSVGGTKKSGSSKKRKRKALEKGTDDEDIKCQKSALGKKRRSETDVVVLDSSNDSICCLTPKEVGKAQVRSKSKRVPSEAVVSSDADSDTSSDLYRLKDSSVMSSDSEDDIKLHRIVDDLENCSHQLKDILDTLPDCSWDITPHDRCVELSNSSRYYQSKVRCNNCNERGHHSSACPMPKKIVACTLCGVRGHLSRSCPDSLCFNCHCPGHPRIECSLRHQRSELCLRCGMRGHGHLNCPDIWRQYHLTTKSGELIKAKWKRNTQKCCFNCASKGHFGHECRYKSNSHFHAPSYPFVARYDGSDDDISENKHHHSSHSRSFSTHHSSSSRTPDRHSHHHSVEKTDTLKKNKKVASSSSSYVSGSTSSCSQHKPDKSKKIASLCVRKENSQSDLSSYSYDDCLCLGSSTTLDITSSDRKHGEHSKANSSPRRLDKNYKNSRSVADSNVQNSASRRQKMTSSPSSHQSGKKSPANCTEGTEKTALSRSAKKRLRLLKMQTSLDTKEPQNLAADCTPRADKNVLSHRARKRLQSFKLQKSLDAKEHKNVVANVVKHQVQMVSKKEKKIKININMKPTTPAQNDTVISNTKDSYEQQRRVVKTDRGFRMTIDF